MGTIIFYIIPLKFIYLWYTVKKYINGNFYRRGSEKKLKEKNIAAFFDIDGTII